MTDNRLILEAITSKRCIEAIYNRMRMKLAPHVLYTKHGDPFLDGVAMERDGKVLTDPRMGTFKLAGLEITRILGTTFVPLPGFDANDPKYAETVPFAVA